MSAEINFILLLLFGIVALATSATNIYYILDDQSSAESNHNIDAIKDSGRDKTIDNIVAKILSGVKKIQSHHNKNLQLSKDDDYDYDGYFKDEDTTLLNKYKNCKGNNCYLLIPGKTPLVIKQSEEDTSVFKASSESDSDEYYKRGGAEIDREKKNSLKSHELPPIEVLSTKEFNNLVPMSWETRADETSDDDDDNVAAEDEGYERDDEDESSSENQNKLYGKMGETDLNLVLNGNVNITATTTSKPFNKKTTDEVTSKDLNMYISDSFEKRLVRSEKDNPDEINKFSTNYVDIGELFKSRAGKDEIEENNRVTNTVFIDYIDPTHEILPKVFPKEIIKKIQKKFNGNFYERSGQLEGRKWGRIKASKARAKKRRATTPPPKESTSSDDDVSGVPAEDPSQEQSSGSSETKYGSKGKKKSNRFKIIDSDNVYNPKTGTFEYGVVKDTTETTETIESESIEVKPSKSKKKSKPRVPGKPEIYMQSLGRLYKEGEDFRKRKAFQMLLDGFRKRLQHFMPKRYHWDPSDFQKLGYFWFNGHQGKEPGPWKIAY